MVSPSKMKRNKLFWGYVDEWDRDPTAAVRRYLIMRNHPMPKCYCGADPTGPYFNAKEHIFCWIAYVKAKQREYTRRKIDEGKRYEAYYVHDRLMAMFDICKGEYTGGAPTDHTFDLDHFRNFYEKRIHRLSEVELAALGGIDRDARDFEDNRKRAAEESWQGLVALDFGKGPGPAQAQMDKIELGFKRDFGKVRWNVVAVTVDALKESSHGLYQTGQDYYQSRAAEAARLYAESQNASDSSPPPDDDCVIVSVTEGGNKRGLRQSSSASEKSAKKARIDTGATSLSAISYSAVTSTKPRSGEKHEDEVVLIDDDVTVIDGVEVVWVG